MRRFLGGLFAIFFSTAPLHAGLFVQTLTPVSGINIISGTVGFQDLDVFFFSGTLNSVSVSYDNIVLSDATLISFGTDFSMGPTFIANDIHTTLPSSFPMVSSYSAGLFPLTGTFHFFVPGPSIDGPISPNAVADLSYTITLDISDPFVPAVPEPSTWAMLLIGFASLGLASRRLRQQARAA